MKIQEIPSKYATVQSIQGSVVSFVKPIQELPLHGQLSLQFLLGVFQHIFFKMFEIANYS